MTDWKGNISAAADPDRWTETNRLTGKLMRPGKKTVKAKTDEVEKSC